MKNRFKNIAIIVFVCAAFLSCKKSVTDNVDPEPQFPITVYPDSSVPKAPMRMFVGGIEITDTAKISKYYKNVPAQYNGQNLIAQFTGNYIFKSPDSLKVASTTTYSYTSFNQKSVMTFTTFSSTLPFPAIVDVEKFFFYQTITMPVSGGYNITRTLLGYGGYTGFKIPVLIYKYHRPLTNNLTALGSIINEFDPSTISKLAPTDTLAVQEYFINYKAKQSM